MADASHLESLSRVDDVITPPAALRQAAYLQNLDETRRQSIEHNEAFWAKVAGELEWFRPWDRVFEWEYPRFRWFVGAQCNITANAHQGNFIPFMTGNVRHGENEMSDISVVFIGDGDFSLPGASAGKFGHYMLACYSCIKVYRFVDGLACDFAGLTPDDFFCHIIEGKHEVIDIGCDDHVGNIFEHSRLVA